MQRQLNWLFLAVFLLSAFSVVEAERKGMRMPVESKRTSYCMNIL